MANTTASISLRQLDLNQSGGVYGNSCALPKMYPREMT
jgi:hypothetical protein